MIEGIDPTKPYTLVHQEWANFLNLRNGDRHPVTGAQVVVADYIPTIGKPDGGAPPPSDPRRFFTIAERYEDEGDGHLARIASHQQIVPGATIEDSGGKKYRVAKDGSLRRVRE
ncbi:MAG TPA: hypothetical protein VJ725_34710 [Thermoanaerobaculia bacterium]|nr:hypothetical protein [Thermoanaerobaculia bacterium]